MRKIPHDVPSGRFKAVQDRQLTCLMPFPGTVLVSARKGTIPPMMRMIPVKTELSFVRGPHGLAAMRLLCMAQVGDFAHTTSGTHMMHSIC